MNILLFKCEKIIRAYLIYSDIIFDFGIMGESGK